tara:strand:- start:19 stop:768 length:750 start_codon:yes stop_codon:yes gene_type:complete
MAYFTVDLKPDYTASILQAGAFASGQVLFDWQPVKVPKGTVCLKSIATLVRPKGDASPTANSFPLDFIFSSSNTVSLGTVRTQADHRPNNDFLGAVEIPVGTYSLGSINSTVIATTSGGNGDSEQASPPIIMTPTVSSDAGFDIIYIAAIATGNFNFTTINTIQTTEAASATIHCDGSGMDLREHFLPGDVLHTATTVGAADADTLIGTVLTVDSATNLTLTDTAAVTHVDGTLIMNINPIRIRLGFEQ